MNASRTRVALVTPAGRGAVASIVVNGPDAVAVVESLFHSARGRRLAEAPADRILYGAWATTGEDVVVARRSESRVEIHCHGGAAAAEAILSALAAGGCDIVSWQGFVQADVTSSIRGAARIALAAATTERTAKILLDQYRGALDLAIEQTMLDLEEGKTAVARARLRELLGWAKFGEHLTSPWRVVIAGPPNVGKSTLINALVGYERAIVFDQPGTTRDVVTAQTAVDGWPIELADTAGLRASAEPLEQAGVQRAGAELRSAELAILVFDITQPWTKELQQLTSEWPNALVVHNKADLLPAATMATVSPADRPAGVLASAKSGWNVPGLLDAIVKRLVPRAPPPGAPILFTAEQSQAIRAAIDHAELRQGEQAIAMLARLVAAGSRE
ncbi:MAG: GTPase [Pirellulales bacterium]